MRAEGSRAADLTLAAAEIDEMAANLREAQGVQHSSSSSSGGAGLMASLGLELFTDSRYYRPLLVGMSLMLFQQVRGCVVVMLGGGAPYHWGFSW